MLPSRCNCKSIKISKSYTVFSMGSDTTTSLLFNANLPTKSISLSGLPTLLIVEIGRSLVPWIKLGADIISAAVLLVFMLLWWFVSFLLVVAVVFSFSIIEISLEATNDYSQRYRIVRFFYYFRIAFLFA